MHDFLIPNAITYFMVKIGVLILVLLVWLVVTAAPVV